MADETTTSWADLLREARGPLVENLKWRTVLLSEVKRDKSPRRWSGKQVTIPIFLAPQQGSGMIGEVASGNATATINAPQVVLTDQAVVNSATAAMAISFSPQVMKQAAGSEDSWAEVVPTKMDRAEKAFARILNEQMVGTDVATGTGALLASITGTSTSSTVTVATTANFYQLYPGRIVDILTRSTGAALAAGARIVTVTPSTGAIVLDAIASVASTSGIYIQGSWGNAIHGVGSAVLTTGTFETIDKAAVAGWQGTDITPAAVTDPSLSILDKAERTAAQNSGDTPTFYLCDPAVVDKYSQGLTVQARWAGEEGTLASGWTGVRYRNKLLIPEFDMPAQTIYGVAMDDLMLYTLDDGPDWDDLTGSIFQRSQSTRTLPVEAWLTWMLQLGFHRCISQVKIGNMTQAS